MSRPRPASGARAALVGTLVLALAAADPALACPAGRVDRHATVTFVHDGDTVRLADGTAVRLIGLNSPELGHDGAPDQPFAIAARRALRALVAGERVGLRLGRERHDDHGRLLAHLYTADGRNVTRILLARGLGWRIVVPPNTGHDRCYGRAEAAARGARRGIWSHPPYRGVPAAELDAGAAGFHVVTGRIRRVGESARAFWLELDGLTLHLAKRDLSYFGPLDPSALRDRRLRVRGWIYRVDGEPRMNLRHPAAVEWLR